MRTVLADDEDAPALATLGQSEEIFVHPRLRPDPVKEVVHREALLHAPGPLVKRLVRCGIDDIVDAVRAQMLESHGGTRANEDVLTRPTI